MNRVQRISFLASLAGFAACLLFWLWQRDQAFAPGVSLLLLFGAPLLAFPVSWGARKLLDARPSPFRAAWLNVLVHLLLLFVLGVAIVEALKVGRVWRVWEIPLPERIGRTLFGVAALATLLTVINLALRGLGAPFALALSRALAVDWLYAWTRNPMVLGTLISLVCLGLWFRSLLVVVWALVPVTPAWLFFVKYYEERELEVRFGKPYLAYKARVSFLFPRPPAR